MAGQVARHDRQVADARAHRENCKIDTTEAGVSSVSCGTAFDIEALARENALGSRIDLVQFDMSKFDANFAILITFPRIPDASTPRTVTPTTKVFVATFGEYKKMTHRQDWKPRTKAPQKRTGSINKCILDLFHFGGLGTPCTPRGLTVEGAPSARSTEWSKVHLHGRLLALLK